MADHRTSDGAVSSNSAATSAAKDFSKETPEQVKAKVERVHELIETPELKELGSDPNVVEAIQQEQIQQIMGAMGSDGTSVSDDDDDDDGTSDDDDE